MALSELARRRIGVLIDFMEELPPEKAAHFYMGSWVTHHENSWTVDGQHGVKAGEEIKESSLVECGMAACAFGWAAMIPEFREAGLGLSISRPGGIAAPTYNGQCAFDAACDFFDIDYHQAQALFESHLELATPDQWAANARRLLREWK